MTNPCPPTRVLEAFAAGASTNATVGAHVGACAECREAVREIRENNSFLAGVRTALAARGEEGASTPGSSELFKPDMVSGYQIQEELHRGGQGVVYRAIQTRTRRTVAIKMLAGGRAATRRQRERFEREIRIAAALRHPNIVTVHDSGYISDGRYGLVMEYIEGVPLDRWSRSLNGARGREARRRALRERLGVMVKVCDAVLCAHQHSIIHRDLKPANIMVDAAGEPHVLDFGVARDFGPEQHTRLTHTGEFAGTLAYASPEQVSGDLSRVDTRTDIYTLGVILYELVSGKMPYAVDGPMSQILRGIESAEPVPLPRRTRRPDDPWVDGEVSTIIRKAMAKDPVRRYQTVAGLRDDLARYLAGEAIEARRDSAWYILRKTVARHRVVVAAAGLIMAILAAFGLAMAWQAHRLQVRGRELASALADSNVDRGRALAAAGDTELAEAAVWPELSRAGVTRIDGPEAGFAGTPTARQAYWALWDIFQKSRRVVTLDTHGMPVCLLYFDQGGRRLSALDNTANLVSWSVAAWNCVRDTNLVAPNDGVTFQSAVATGGSIAVFGGGFLRIVDPETGSVEVQTNDPGEEALTGTFSPDGTLLATIGRDNRLRVRNSRSLASVVTIAESTVSEVGLSFFCRPTFSLDGGVVAAARPEGAFGLWNTASGVLERTLCWPDSLASYSRLEVRPSRIAFGPDGAIAASLYDHVVVWPADGRVPVDLGVPGSTIQTIAFLPGSEGRTLVSSGASHGDKNGVTVAWDLATNGRVATFRHSTAMNTCVASPDGRLIAVGDMSGRVQVYDAAPQPHVAVLHAAVGMVSLSALSADGRLIALTAAPESQTGSEVLLIDLKSGTTLSRFHRTGSGIRDIEFAPDGSSLYEGEMNGRIIRWDLHSGAALREFIAPDPAAPGASQHRREPLAPDSVMDVNQMRLSPDGRILARARDDGLIDLWDSASGRWIDWLDSGSTEHAVIDFSRDGSTLIARHPGKCVLWNVQARQIKRTIATEGGEGSGAVRWSPDGAIIACRVPDGIRFLDAGTGRVRAENKVPETAGLGMVFHPNGSVLFASASDSSIRLWDTRTGRELLSLQKHADLIFSLLLTPDGNTLISSDASGTVLVWDLTYYNDRIRRELAYRASHAADRIGGSRTEQR